MFRWCLEEFIQWHVGKVIIENAETMWGCDDKPDRIDGSEIRLKFIFINCRLNICCLKCVEILLNFWQSM